MSTGGHIRGRVFFREAPHDYQMSSGHVLHLTTNFGMEVINTATGKILASDNACNFPLMVEQCHRAVGAAREAWSYEFRQKDLRAGRRR